MLNQFSKKSSLYFDNQFITVNSQHYEGLMELSQKGIVYCEDRS